MYKKYPHGEMVYIHTAATFKTVFVGVFNLGLGTWFLKPKKKNLSNNIPKKNVLVNAMYVKSIR